MTLHYKTNAIPSTSLCMDWDSLELQVAKIQLIQVEAMGPGSSASKTNRMTGGSTKIILRAADPIVHLP